MRRLAVPLLVALASLLLSGRGEGGERSESRTAEERMLNDARRRAVRRGCDWIVARKNDDGSFGDNKGLVALTALSALALMSEGSGMGRGPHGEVVTKAVRYLVGLLERKDEKQPEGYFYASGDNSSKMHGQGYATLALASALGSASDDPRNEVTAGRIRTALEKAVRCAERSQSGTGGWGYAPDSHQEHEGSVTVTIAQGLRAARDAGVLVSRDTVVRGLEYLRKSQKSRPSPSLRADEDGSFKYSINTEKSTYALTAAALSSFFLFGEYGARPEDRERLDRGIAYLKRTLPDQMSRREWHFYGNFYAAWVAWQRDGDAPDPLPGQSWGSDPSSSDILRTTQLWGPWHRKVYPDLLRAQREDGSWSDPNDQYNFGDLLPTTFAVLTLAIPDEQIPVFQR